MAYSTIKLHNCIKISTYSTRLITSSYSQKQKLILPNEVKTDESYNNQINGKPNNININPYFRKKIGEVYTIYEKLSGMDEVRMAQDKVINIQDQLNDAQNKRRSFIQELSQIRKELQSLHSEILNCGRGESRYLDLVKKEIDVS